MDITKVLAITAALITIGGVIFAGVRWSVLQAARRQEHLHPWIHNLRPPRSIASCNGWLVVCWQSR